MNIHPKYRVGWLLFTLPLISTLNISVAPSRAATFGSATTLVNLTNFSTNAESSSASVDTTVFAISPIESTSDSDFLDDLSIEDSIIAETADGSVAATTDFTTVAFFPPVGSSVVVNEVDNEAFGTGESYLGKSQTESTVLANFFLNPEAGTTETFSFDYNIFWELEAAANEARESSVATANVSLTVCGRTALGENPLFCDSLSTFGSIESPDTVDTFTFQQSDTFSLDVLSNPVVAFDPTLNLRQADFFALGSYQREFNTPIYLTLAEVQNTEVRVSRTNSGDPVSVPEPSATIALLSLSAIVIALNTRKN